jgi:drug/metabolite transporter (DMT)-like permease
MAICPGADAPPRFVAATSVTAETAQKSTLPVSRRVERETAAYIALLATATIWGTTPVGTKSALDTYTPFILSIGRWLIALGVVLLLMRRAGVRPILDWRTGVLGLFGIFGFNVFFTFGLGRTSAANGALLGGALPVVVAVISFLVLGERLSPLRWSGIALSMIGVVVTVLGATLNASVLGNVLVFCAVLSWSIYTIFQRERLRGEPIMGIISGSAIIGMALMIPFAAAEWFRDAPPAPSLGLAVVILYLSLGPALAANYMWVFALGRVPASLAAVFSNLAPIVGIVAAGVILDEPITRYHVLGSLLVILGVLLTTWRRRAGNG